MNSRIADLIAEFKILAADADMSDSEIDKIIIGQLGEDEDDIIDYFEEKIEELEGSDDLDLDLGDFDDDDGFDDENDFIDDEFDEFDISRYERYRNIDDEKDYHISTLDPDYFPRGR